MKSGIFSSRIQLNALNIHRVKTSKWESRQAVEASILQHSGGAMPLRPSWPNISKVHQNRTLENYQFLERWCRINFWHLRAPSNLSKHPNRTASDKARDWRHWTNLWKHLKIRCVNIVFKNLKRKNILLLYFFKIDFWYYQLSIFSKKYKVVLMIFIVVSKK